MLGVIESIPVAFLPQAVSGLPGPGPARSGRLWAFSWGRIEHEALCCLPNTLSPTIPCPACLALPACCLPFQHLSLCKSSFSWGIWEGEEGGRGCWELHRLQFKSWTVPLTHRPPPHGQVFMASSIDAKCEYGPGHIAQLFRVSS